MLYRFFFFPNEGMRAHLKQGMDSVSQSTYCRNYLLGEYCTLSSFSIDLLRIRIVCLFVFLYSFATKCDDMGNKYSKILHK